MHKTRIPAWAVLTLISLVAALLLGGTYELTKDAIGAQEEEKAAATRLELVPGAASFDELTAEGALSSLFAGLDENGEAIGYVATLSVTGFGGPVEIIAGFDPDGVLTGIRVGGSSFSETPGLGAKAKEPAFTDQFTGLTVPVALHEDVDAITSATITSNAVVRGVNSAADEVGKVAGFAASAPANVGQTADGRFYAEVQGFAGPVYVEIALDDSGAVSAITIGNDQFNETPGYGKRAQEPDFFNQFIGLSGTLTLGDQVDALSGATVTSTAVVKAVNQALAFSRGETVEAEVPADTQTSATTSATGTATTDEPAPAVSLLDNGHYAAEVKGYAGPVYVEVALDDNKAITEIVIGNDAFAETPGFGAKAREPEFIDQFIGKSSVALGENVDAIAGATVTSKAVEKALNAIFAFVNGDAADTETSATGVADTETSATGTATTDEPAPAVTQLDNGRYAVEVKGYAGPVYVEVALDDNKAITEIVIGNDAFAETPGFGAKAREPEFIDQFIGKSSVVLGENVDAIAGATVTSKAVEKALNAIFAFVNGDAADTETSATGAADTETSANGTADTETSATGTATTDEPAPAVTLLDNGRYAVEVKGYAGPVYVEVALDDNKAITEIVIGNDAFAETPGFGAKAREPEFIDQFIGKSSVALGENVDAIAGATVTSKAVEKALNAIFEFAASADTATAATGTAQ